jgi:hypothetical protein
MFVTLQLTHRARMQLNKCQKCQCDTDGASKVSDKRQAAGWSAAPKLLRKIFKAASAALWLAAGQKAQVLGSQALSPPSKGSAGTAMTIQRKCCLSNEQYGANQGVANGRNVRAFAVPGVAHDLH